MVNHSRITLALLSAAFAATSLAQSSDGRGTPPSKSAPQSNGVPTIQVQTDLVLLDIVVEDKGGRAVHGLKPNDFEITEDSARQSVRTFQEHALLGAPLVRRDAPTLQPGYFVDYSPIASSGALTILLLDSLNTPIEDQAYVMSQLQQYVKHAAPDSRVAIFGLANRLFMLQGFTSDTKVLDRALSTKASPVKSSLMGAPSGYSADTNAMSNIMNTSGQASQAIEQTTENLQQFEAEAHSLQTRLRVQHTLDAFTVLGHYLAGLPGRKNVVWFSGSFPTEVLPNPALADPFGVSQVDHEQFQRTINLFARSQIAIYPVDAHGLQTPPSYDVTNAPLAQPRPSINVLNTRSGVDNDPTRIESQDVRSGREQMDERATMEAMARDTGGHAFYNTNDLATAVAKTMDAGSNFYTVAYSPSNHARDGRYRTIHVTLSGSAASRGLKLAYRRGYFADRGNTPGSESAAVTSATLDPQQAANALTGTVMSHGAPAPEEVLFEARIVPAAAASEATIVPGNRLNPKIAVTGPYRRYAVDYVALPNQFTLVQGSTGRRTGAIEFLAYLYDNKGQLLVLDGRTVKLDLSAEDYARYLKKPLSIHLELSAPIKTGRFVRVAVRDVPSDRYGVIETELARAQAPGPPVGQRP